VKVQETQLTRGVAANEPIPFLAMARDTWIFGKGSDFLGDIKVKQSDQIITGSAGAWKFWRIDEIHFRKIGDSVAFLAMRCIQVEKRA